MTAAPGGSTERIAALTLDERSVLRRSPQIEHERAVAVTDLLKDNRFAPVSGLAGPYRLHLAVEENRLTMAVSGSNGDGENIVLPLFP